AEDGIRDKLVTGVQTCALPIFGPGARMFGTSGTRRRRDQPPGPQRTPRRDQPTPELVARTSSHDRLNARRGPRYWPPFPSSATRSEERRVGKEGRARWSPCNEI